jgi:NADH-quinone oxidoreductase subunit N
VIAAFVLGQVEQIPSPSIDWPSLVPLLILAGGGIVMLTVASMIKPLPKWFGSAATVLVAGAAFVSVFPLWARFHHHGALTTLSGAWGLDGFSLFLTAVIACSVILAALVFDDYLRLEGIDGIEPYVLMLLSASGGVIMAGANDLIVMFLGLEILSIAVYVMAAMQLRRIESQESGIKYFVLGAFSSAFFLYGIALTYGATGSTNLVHIREFLATSTLTEDAMLFAGFALLLVGFGFKVSAVPFHAWAPDVYQGAPSPAVAYMASGVKVAGFAGLLRVFTAAFASYSDDWRPGVYVLAVLSLVIGAVAAVAQRDVKRMMAFSSISHGGFVLVGVQAASARGTSSALFYLAAYTFMVAGSFAIITIVAAPGDRDHSLDSYRGLSRRRPSLALAFTILLFAQTGVPFTTGFVAKFGVITAAVDARSFWLAIIAMLAAVISAILYLRIVMTMWVAGEDPDAHGEPAVASAPLRIPPAAGIAVAIAVAVTVVFGIAPGPIDKIAHDAVPTLVAFGN